MAWIEIGDTYLNQTQMDNNALEVYSFFRGKGWATESIAALCGNMQRESTINPVVRTSTTSGAYGLTQWITNKSKMINWCTSNGYSYASGIGQCNYIEWERLNPSAADQWYGRNEYSGITFTNFAHNDMGYSVAELTRCFWASYERSAGYDPQRATYSQHYYELFGGQPGPGPSGDFPKWLLFNKRNKWYWKPGGRKY